MFSHVPTTYNIALHLFSLLCLVTFTKSLLEKNKLNNIYTNSISLCYSISISGKYLSNIYTSQSGISIIGR